jgi:hypothetical protein
MRTTPDTTGDLLAYNEQRRKLVEGAFDQILGSVQQVEKQETGPKAEALRNFAVFIQERKANVQHQYDKLLGAIKDKKPVQADIKKTELNTLIADTQSAYDEMRTSSSNESESHANEFESVTNGYAGDTVHVHTYSGGVLVMKERALHRIGMGPEPRSTSNLLPRLRIPMGKNRTVTHDTSGINDLDLDDQQPTG